MSIRPTLEAADAAETEWPVIVVGAGPAGAFSAYRLARAGIGVLLVEAQSFPRAKVCGGCLNARTLAFLTDSGLGQLPASLGAQPIDRFELHAAGRTARLRMPPGLAVSRAALDAGLVEAAVRAGAHFLPETRAALGPGDSGARTVRLTRTGHDLRSRHVVVADGLGGSFLPAESGRRARASAGSRIGAGAVLDDVRGEYQPGVLHMAVGRRGYVGVTRVENGRLDVAAALDRSALAADGGAAAAIARLLDEAGLPALGDGAAAWRGTAALSRRATRVAFERVFLIGDAAGYVEPFTGEGISWALEAGREISNLLTEPPKSKPVDALWRDRYRRRIARRQRWCRTVSWSLKRPALVASMTWLLGKTPALAGPLMAHLNQAPEGRAS